MRTELFDYDLPRELIAQEPIEPRTSSRLMVIERSRAAISHHSFTDLPGFLRAGDCLVLNNSRVFPGRLRARKSGTGGRVEILLLERLEPGKWRALTRGASLRQGASLDVEGGDIRGEIIEGPAEGKSVILFTSAVSGDIDEAVLSRGEVPLPPYISREVPDPERYQTVYSDQESSAAAPTAGLHFTLELLDSMRSEGVVITELELAVGLDTFAPVREDQVEEHSMHSEWFSIPEGCAGAINGCTGRVVAVGTTAVRAIESAAEKGTGGNVAPVEDRTSLFITPGYSFRAVDAMITNFHFPRSTLLMLVCAFGGTDLIMDAYRQAVSERYRFYSFGDAMLVV